MTLPSAPFRFGQRVRCSQGYPRFETVEAAITGISYDPRLDVLPHYTITEPDGRQTARVPYHELVPVTAPPGVG